MRTGSGTGTPGGDPRHDPYDTGRDWPVERLAGTYGLDPADLRRTLHLADHAVRTADAGADAPRRQDLEDIAAHADALADALECASTGSLVSLLLVHPRLHPSNVLIDPQAHRARLVGLTRWLADTAREMVEQLSASRDKVQYNADELQAGQGVDGLNEADGRRKTPQRKPRSGRTAPPSGKELAVVGLLSDLWLRAHNKRPGVNYRRGNKDAADRRVPDAGGRFVLAVAAELFGLTMSDQRLRTVFARLKEQRELGAKHRD